MTASARTGLRPVTVIDTGSPATMLPSARRKTAVTLWVVFVGLVDVVSFRTAVTVHNFVGFVLIANFFVWLVFYLTSDRIRAYHSELNPKKHFIGAIRQIYYYAFGIFRGDPNPFHATPYNKFNPLQSMIYQIIMMLCLPVQIYTGILLWDVKRFQAQVDFFGGVRVIDTVHVLIFIVFVFYIFVHVYLGSLGHTRTTHYKAMLTGYEDIDEAPAGKPHA